VPETGHSRIPFSDYARQLSRNIVVASGVSPDQVELTVDMETVVLPVEKAIPCGLILNELVTNALKHAFPQGRSGTVRVGLHSTSSGELALSVADDGIGLRSDFAIEHYGSLGMQLVSDLAAQLDARVALESHGGTKVSIILPGKDGHRT
jgi:two-component sensor histidine kinase